MTGRGLVKNLGRQVAALCWRADPVPEVLLITSLNSRRWILPKGWPMAKESSAQSAAYEALEEAGVAGEVSPAPIGHYHYTKQKKSRTLICRVDVYPLLVRLQLQTWPEKGRRDIAWMPIDEAARKVDEAELRLLLLDFARQRAAA